MMLEMERYRNLDGKRTQVVCAIEECNFRRTVFSLLVSVCFDLVLVTIVQ